MLPRLHLKCRTRRPGRYGPAVLVRHTGHAADGRSNLFDVLRADELGANMTTPPGGLGGVVEGSTLDVCASKGCPDGLIISPRSVDDTKNTPLAGGGSPVTNWMNYRRGEAQTARRLRPAPCRERMPQAVRVEGPDRPLSPSESGEGARETVWTAQPSAGPETNRLSLTPSPIQANGWGPAKKGGDR